MSKYLDLAKRIYDAAGKQENISLVTHCATRLRLTIKEPSTKLVEEIKQVEGVMGVVVNNNQYQVVVGTDVPNVYREFVHLGNFEKGGTVSEDGTEKIWRKVVDFIQATFIPVLPVLVAAGLVSATLTILTAFFNLPTDSGTYAILSAINNAGFFFLPVFIGYTSARKLGLAPIMGAYLGAILVSSGINGVADLDFFGIPVTAVSYNNSVLPVILGVLLMNYVDRFADYISPKEVKFFTRPLITILITTPIVLIALGPLGIFVGNGLTAVLSFINEHLGWLSVGLMGGLTPILVMTGMNQTLFPVVFSSLSEFGYDAFVMPGMLAANTAIGGAALAVAFKTINEKRKQIAISSGITGVVGITEPSLYGVLLPLGKPLIGAIIGGTVGGLFAGIFQIKQYAIVSPGIAAIPTFIAPDGSLGNMYLAIATIVISVVVAFAATLLLGFNKEE